jgi:post-segregation antitoxin (ccd killing protein)
LRNFLSVSLVLLIGENLSKYTTVSTKIPLELKEKMKELKIKPSKLLRKAIEDEIKRRETEKLKEELEKLRPVLDKVSMEEIVESIREDRMRR